MLELPAVKCNGAMRSGCRRTDGIDYISKRPQQSSDFAPYPPTLFYSPSLSTWIVGQRVGAHRET